MTGDSVQFVPQSRSYMEMLHICNAHVKYIEEDAEVAVDQYVRSAVEGTQSGGSRNERRA